MDRYDDGFWMYSLCVDCNNKTGSRYTTAYKEFVFQALTNPQLVDDQGRALVYLQNLYPLRAIKQIFAMFLSILPHEPSTIWQNIRDFVRRRDQVIPDDAPLVYLYKNISSTNRIVPWCAISEVFTQRPTIALAEIAWSPIGIIFCEHEPSDNRFAHMACINEWGKHGFKDKASITMQLPQLYVNTDHPLAYGSLQEIEEWRKKNGVMWAVAQSGDTSLPNSVSLTGKRPRK